MSSTSRFFVLMLATISVSGCAFGPRSRDHAYRLTEIGDRYFLLSPNGAHARDVVRSNRSVPGAEHLQNNPAATADCSIRVSGFSVAPAVSRRSGKWLTEVLRSEDWVDDKKRADLIEHWNTFLGRLSELRTTDCLTEQEYGAIRENIAQRLSPPADENLYFYYSFGPGGFVDLREGMRLRIQRLTPGAGREGSQEYASTSKISEVSYNVVRTGKGLLSLSKTDNEIETRQPAPEWQTLPELTLAFRFPPTLFLRIFLQNVTVLGDLKTPAVLIEADNLKALDAATSALLRRSDTPCRSVNDIVKTCVAFDGQVSVSPMIGIYVNGQRTFVPVGTSLASALLFESRPKKRGVLIRSVRIRRRFDTKYVEIRFVPNKVATQQLFLVEGDKVSWGESP